MAQPAIIPLQTSHPESFFQDLEAVVLGGAIAPHLGTRHRARA
jgi:hypothetical protein